MKPSFALNFTDTSIGLLHRTSRGWLEVGTVPVDEPDLPKALAYLRGSALGLEPRGITTKLVIPNSQIRYMTLAAPGPDAASRRAQIKAGLEGKTPYPVDELVFDWTGTGKTVQVAIVARETLDEAESFARDNRFNPVCFVAIPEPGSFGKEPWFGPTALAPTILTDGEKVERDQDPIHIVGRSAKPDASPSDDVAAVAEPTENVPEAAATPISDPKEPILPAPQEPVPDPVEAAATATLSDDPVVPQMGDAPIVVEAEANSEKPVPANRWPTRAPTTRRITARYQAAPRRRTAWLRQSLGRLRPRSPKDWTALVRNLVSARVTGSVIDDRIDPLDSDLADLPPIAPQGLPPRCAPTLPSLLPPNRNRPGRASRPPRSPIRVGQAHRPRRRG